MKTFVFADKKVTFRALRRSFGLNIVVFSVELLGKAEKALFLGGKIIKAYGKENYAHAFGAKGDGYFMEIGAGLY